VATQEPQAEGEAPPPAKPAAPTPADTAAEASTAEPSRAEPPAVKNPYAFPEGGAVEDVAGKVETVRQIIDGLAFKAQSHLARMTGQEPDRTGSTRIDAEAEKDAYVATLRSQYRMMRELMHQVARCPNASPDQPVASRSAPIQALKEEIDRYDRAPATSSETKSHVQTLKPLVVRWKSIYIDPRQTERASEPNWVVPRQLELNWCPSG
jgi:hypothetical protein